MLKINQTWLALGAVFLASQALAEPIAELSTAVEPSEPKSKVRIELHDEFQSSALKGIHSVPTADGRGLTPPNVDGRVWLDYSIGEPFRLLYWQRYSVVESQGGLMKDPRIGLRVLDLFNVDNLSTTYDLFIQPAMTPTSKDAGLILDAGIRADNTYHIPRSRWDLTFLAEIISSQYHTGKSGINLGGFLSPGASYKISKMFATQHDVVIPFEHQRGNSFSSFAWGASGRPLLQNGFGITFTDTTSLGVLVNNYLFAPLTWKNTFLSASITLALM